ncbi:MAG: hypothetical protein P8H03_05815, partial [Emcibacteraceae bacterium]|nr:hypothetical protein [Emcibacteraceae bacterium]
MATTTANKMSTLISKGKLPAFQVTQLIHQQYIKDLNCEGIAGLSETDLQKLINNLDVRDWNNVKHWVHDGIDLLYAFAMNIKSDAALAAANLHMVNTFLIKMIHVDQSNKLHLDPNNWEGIHSSMGAFIHRVL